jgi:hypothetical protein
MGRTTGNSAKVVSSKNEGPFLLTQASCSPTVEV